MYQFYRKYFTNVQSIKPKTMTMFRFYTPYLIEKVYSNRIFYLNKPFQLNGTVIHFNISCLFF